MWSTRGCKNNRWAFINVESNTEIAWRSSCTKLASWEEISEINNKLSSELTAEPCRLEDWDKLDYAWLKKRDFLNETHDSKLMMQILHATGVFLFCFFSYAAKVTELVFINPPKPENMIWKAEWINRLRWYLLIADVLMLGKDTSACGNLTLRLYLSKPKK